MLVAAFGRVISRDGQDRRLGVGHLNHLGVGHRVSTRIFRMPRTGDGVVAWTGCVSDGFVELHRDGATIVRDREHRSFRGKSALHFHVFRGQFFVPFWVDGVHHSEGGGGGGRVAASVCGGEAHRDGRVAAAGDLVTGEVVGPSDVSTVVGDHGSTS